MSSSTIETSRRLSKRTTTHRPLVLTMLMSAIEATIVATAMPQIASSLGGFSLYR